ncbi:UDP-glucose dehydrogenase family protein [Arthrobacter psychrochitiniphilus]|uniref:UDP-glucose 6-dehydrogenase n=1 Tax=Arthrobacter psychrochitiniphilus TaxID=291045 RepID=A0A2V3DVB1_9MICC|nr:UDP-glucose/GDP-mannose dehydrogenase family protein [Arthrobacter psychrochitiniphilus]NYG16582.1 UDPglucose 6-dehydrogenase [Arthrobacter psychrochitiniphilus]PXA69298.1 UDP-glucose 6-dehydrogenase [Arthrobacter psychrochitiniphilus]
MKISVIGCGYLGAVHAACMAKLGHEVVGIDVDPHKVAELSAARAPFFEPGLEELLSEVQATGRLTFTTDMAAAAGSEVHFICVGTPQKKGEKAADLSYVDAATNALAPYVGAGELVVGKSTVPVGTAERLAELIQEHQPEAHLAWNPEFLREGHAVKDTLTPDRFVYGVPGAAEDHPAVELLDEVYATPLSSGTPRLVADYATAELVKSAANSFLATKISFINAMSEVCDAAGADVTLLADAIGMDDRIGRKFLNAGIGFGGGCLPKDIRSFMARAGELGADQALTFLREVDDINMRRRTRMVELTREICNGTLLGQRITVLGAAFKPNSDDVRDSPALSIAAQLQLQGAVVTVTDPQSLSNAARRFPELNYEPDLTAALLNADAVLLLTEWQQYLELDPHTVISQVRSPRILDGRNVLEPSKWRAAGWTYRGMGRP